MIRQLLSREADDHVLLALHEAKVRPFHLRATPSNTQHPLREYPK